MLLLRSSSGARPANPTINRRNSLAIGLRHCWLAGPGGIVKDLVGRNDGTVVSAYPTQGYRGQALSFDGSAGGVTFNSDTVIYQNRPFTVIARAILADFTPNVYPHLLTLKSDGANPWELSFSNQASYDGILIGSATTFSKIKTGTSSATLTAGWSHIAVTYNGAGAFTDSNYKIYLNGTLLTNAGAGAFSGLTNSTTWGKPPAGGGNNLWDGRCEYGLVYDRVLSQAEIQFDWLNPYSYLVAGRQGIFIPPPGPTTGTSALTAAAATLAASGTIVNAYTGTSALSAAAATLAATGTISGAAPASSNFMLLGVG